MDGADQLTSGPSAALASFTGPTEIRLREEQLSQATLELVHRPLEGVAGVQSRALEDNLTAVFEPLLNLRAFPRSLCQIVVQGLAPAPAAYPSSSPFGAPSQRNGWPRDSNADEDEDMDGEQTEETGSPLAGYSFSGRAAALNAASLATLHAGSVGLRAFPLAVSLALTDDGDMLVDPTLDEETSAQARFGFGWAFGTGISSKKESGEDEEAELVWAEAEGDFTKLEFDAARTLSRRKAEEVLDFVKEKVGEYFEQ